MKTRETLSIVFVCMGNICRSPSAEAIFTAKAQERGLANTFIIDSAGTHNYHEGNSPDTRAITLGQARGYNLTNLRARQITLGDFLIYDYIIAMDLDNLQALRYLCPPKWQGTLALMLDYHPSMPKNAEVPDPYYGGDKGFYKVIDMLEQACEGLLDYLASQSNAK